MLKLNLYFIFILLIPIINIGLIKVFFKNEKLLDLIYKISPILSLIGLMTIFRFLKHNDIVLNLLYFNHDILMGFLVNKSVFILLVSLDLVWLLFIFYSSRYFVLNKNNNSENLKIAFIFIVFFLHLIIISKDLLSLLLFYSLTIIFSYIFSSKYLFKTETKFSLFFNFLIYLELFFLFLAIVLTYKFAGSLYLDQSKISLINNKYVLLLFLLFFAGVFLPILIPLYLYFHEAKLNPFVVYIFYCIAFAFISAVIFIKILKNIFGMHLLYDMNQSINFISYLNIIIIFNLLVISVFAIRADNIKSLFFYIFFHQFLMMIFSINFFSIYDITKLYVPLFSFLFTMTTLFFTFNNISLYYDHHNSSSNQGLFQIMPINHTFLIFAFSAIIGIMPSYGMVDKFFVLKNIIKEENFNSFIIILINFFSIIIIYFKNFKLIFTKINTEKTKQNNDFAEHLESDSSLSVTNFISVIILFSGIILFPILAKFIT